MHGVHVTKPPTWSKQQLLPALKPSLHHILSESDDNIIITEADMLPYGGIDKYRHSFIEEATIKRLAFHFFMHASQHVRTMQDVPY